MSILKGVMKILNYELDKVPEVKNIKEFVFDATNWHVIKEKLPPGKDYSNHSLINLIEEFLKYNHYSNNDISFGQIAKNMGIIIIKNIDFRHLVVKEFLKEVMTTTVDGLPFAQALLFLIQHIVTEIPVYQWNNDTVQIELIKNITSEIKPYTSIYYNKTITALKASPKMIISNLTDFALPLIRKLGWIAKNSKDNAIAQKKNVTSKNPN